MVTKITPEEEKLKEKMKEIRIKEKEKEAQKIASSLGVDYINLKGFPINPQEALILIPQEEAERLKVICFLKVGNEARLGAINPLDPAIDELEKKLKEEYNLNIKRYLISEYSFNLAFDFYKYIPKIRKIVKGVEITEEELEKFKARVKTLEDLNKEVQKISITDLVILIIAGAIQNRASDIHIEAEEFEIKTRFRIDGVLYVAATLPKKNWPQVISRIKLISGLKINIIDKPQDGRFTIFLTNDKIDVRVSCLPTAYGESVVMRLLLSSAAGLAFEQLGVRGLAEKQLKEQVMRPNGMIITTGPTGSGKTTTLYAILNKLNTPDKKIITLEDPVEYKLKGIMQSQIDISRGYTFAAGLRSILRQDPNVVMVGEIRDIETVEIAIQAALTGHLVISTIHTNSAAGAIPRFLSMGAKSFLLAPALNAIIGQRLIRRICKSCKEEIKLDEETLERVKNILREIPEVSGYKVDLENLKFYKGKGCKECNNLGYRGRVGIYEVLTMSKEIEEIILSGKVSEYLMQEIGIKQGMITMVQDGLLKVIDGVTTVEEVFRVTE